MSTAPPATPPAATPGSPTPARPPGRPVTPWWAVLLTIAGVVVVLGLVVGVAGSFVVFAATSSATETVRADEVSGVRILGASGDVSVAVDEDLRDSVVVDIETTTRWQGAEVRSETEDGELVVEVRCDGEGGWGWTACLGEYDVRLGPEADLTVDLAAGGVDGAGLAGDVTVDVATGGVSLRELGSSRVDVDIATGGVDLAFDEPPVDVSATANVGGITIELPDDGSSYAVTSDVGVAGEEIAVDTDRSASRTIDVATNVGGVYVGYVGAAEHDWDGDLDGAGR